LHLKTEDVQRVWKVASERTGGRRITARVVKNVVQTLNLAIARPKGRSFQGERKDRHRLISDCFGQLLTLLSQRADYPSVVAKVQELHGLVEGLFVRPQLTPTKA
jgi:hypothetical protein